MLASLLVVASLGAGFAVGEQGASSLGVAGAVTGRGDLPDAGFYNPAAWAITPGLRVSAGVTALAPTITHVGRDGARSDAESKTHTPPNAYASYGFDRFGVGVAFGTPFGAGVAWGDTWPGRFLLTEIDLKVLELAPSLAVRLTDQIAIAAGPRFDFADVYLAKGINAVVSEGAVELGGDAVAIGGQAALLIGPIGPVSIGASYRSRVALELSGRAHFTDVPVELSQQAHDGAVTTAITLPDRIALGGALTLGDTTVSLDLEAYLWSTVDELRIDFADERTPDVTEPRRFENTLAVRAGVEQRDILTDLALRAGVAYDPTPAPAATLMPDTPDGNRVLLALGGSYMLIGGLSLDASLAHVFIISPTAADGDNAYPGSYDASANVASFGVSYRL